MGTVAEFGDVMIKQTESYSIEFDFVKNKFTVTCLSSGKNHVEKRANAILLQKAWKELDALSNLEIDQMCDTTFRRNLTAAGGNFANCFAIVWLSVIIICVIGALIVWFAD